MARRLATSVLAAALLAALGGGVRAGDTPPCEWLSPPANGTVNVGEPFLVSFTHPDPKLAENETFTTFVTQGSFTDVLIVEGVGLDFALPVVLHFPTSYTGTVNPANLSIETLFRLPGDINPRGCSARSLTVLGPYPTPVPTPPPNLTPGTIIVRTGYLNEIYVARDTLEYQAPPIYYINEGTGEFFLNYTYSPGEQANARVVPAYNPLGSIVGAGDYMLIPLSLELNPDASEEFQNLFVVESYFRIVGQTSDGSAFGTRVRLRVNFVDSVDQFPATPAPPNFGTRTPLPSPTPSSSPSPTESPVPTVDPSASPTDTETPTPTNTQAPTETPIPSSTSSPTPSASPSTTPTIDPNGDGIVDSADAAPDPVWVVPLLLRSSG